MASNKSLHAAKKTKKDEFYTRREDIENELSHYADHFRDKVVYCNCDDPVTSEFWQFFMRNFRPWGLKKLIATHYEPDEKNYAYMLEISEDTNGDGVVDWRDEPTITQIPCNGDFRSAACIELLKQADIVVTNPPFSLFREYIGTLIGHGVHFLIIGSQNNVTYKDVFPLLQNDKVWLGYNNGDMAFKVPDNYEARETRFWIDDDGQKWRSLGNIAWYTNLDIKKRHEELILVRRFSAETYPEYSNFEGCVNVDKVSEIPRDFGGYMGVPITFLDKYNPEQFEIIGFSSTLAKPMSSVAPKGTYMGGGPRFYTPCPDDKDKSRGYLYHREYDRIVIRNRHPEEPKQ